MVNLFDIKLFPNPIARKEQKYFQKYELNRINHPYKKIKKTFFYY